MFFFSNNLKIYKIFIKQKKKKITKNGVLVAFKHLTFSKNFNIHTNIYTNFNILILCIYVHLYVYLLV